MSETTANKFFSKIDINILLEYLRITKGYSIGVEEHKMAYRLFLQLAQSGQLPETERALCIILGPFICKTAHQQRTLAKDVRDWITMQDENKKPSEALDFIIKNVIKKIKRKTNFWRNLLKLLRVLAVIFMIIFLIEQILFPFMTGDDIYGGGRTAKETPIFPETNVFDKYKRLIYSSLIGLVIAYIIVNFLSLKIEKKNIETFLKRKQLNPGKQFQISRLFSSEIRQIFFPVSALASTVKKYNNPIYEKSSEIDVDRSIYKTLDNGGFIQTINASQTRSPEYLVLIDQKTYADHQAAYMEEMITFLKSFDVMTDIFYFDGDPRSCSSKKDRKNYNLQQLAQYYDKHNLLIFASTIEFFDFRALDFAAWIEQLNPWISKTIFTLEQPSTNNVAHELLQEAFELYPATKEGLEQYITSPFNSLGHFSKEIPELFTRNPLSWIEKQAPEAEKIDWAIFELKQFLDEDGFRWLTACAVYPDINWKLTLFLGHNLSNDNAKILFEPGKGLNLFQLPWFRFGRMPDWLRLRLIYEMPEGFESEVRKTLYNLFELGLYEPISDFKLEFNDTKDLYFIRRIFKEFQEKAPKFSPWKDYIFVSYMADRLAIKIPDKTLKFKVSPHTLTEKLDSVLLHRFIGPVIFFAVMLLVFQALFAWAELPMSLIENIVGWLAESVKNTLPDHWLTSLLTDGVLAGIGGIIVFAPQIAILFFLTAILEEIGYMARATSLFDRFMRIFGMNGRSIVNLVSGGGCAIPAIMATRSIDDWKVRMTTILVTPLIACPARIPIYTVLIGFVVPATTIGIFNLQALAFLGLFLLGILAAFTYAFILKNLIKSEENSPSIVALPDYRKPDMRKVVMIVWEKSTAFILKSGRIILSISILLWFLVSFGPPGAVSRAEKVAQKSAQLNNLNEENTKDLIDAQRIEASFAGHLGKFIEPVIKPLGFDWKIGIALITSFAAREVFVGTMATIYSIGHQDDEFSIREKMAKQRDPVTKELVYTPATSLSLLLFYVFAMMCMSTVAVIREETGSWKWPIIQFVVLGAMAYLSAFAAYQLLS